MQSKTTEAVKLTTEDHARAMKVGEAAPFLSELLGYEVSVPLLRQYARDSVVPCVRCGLVWLFYKSDLIAWKQNGGRATSGLRAPPTGGAREQKSTHQPEPAEAQP